MRAAVEMLAALLLVGGAGIVALAALGVARLTDPFMRMHAAAKAGVAGAGLLLLGAGLAFGTPGALLTSLAAVGFLVLTAPLASHALGRAAYVAGAPLGAASLADALSGVLHRKVFDIDPARTARPRPAREPFAKDNAMSAIPEFRRPADPAFLQRGQQAAEPVALRRILCCLVGGPAQAEATEEAIALARDACAQLVGLSGAGQSSPEWRGPYGIGGAFWSEWLASRSRARMRENAAAALHHFHEATSAAPQIDAQARHEEAEPRVLARLLAGHDLVVLPAGAGPHGFACDPRDEIASGLARARVAPVLRVARRPRRPVRDVVLVVGSSEACGALAAGLVRSGLWPQASIAIQPVADDRHGVRAMADAQAGLLRAHGRRVTVLPSVDLDFEAPDLRARLLRYDAAVLSCLSTRHGGFMDSIRNCVHEVTAEAVPVTLLP
ncbi:monovalent cation/H(+) antiporter subunit G [Roseomonas sp. AR75]|uniref:cation:proton antiporter n=1 Tax=Roseomonas sp. AR75 TaxID=2562311 RepID=UPI0010C0ACE5|nr:monovalent cation/H(+) antiporter subunit G [Roseomonas sp. AR75]